MKVIYKIHVRKGVSVDVSPEAKNISLENADVRWEIGQSKKLEEISLEFKGAELKIDDKGVINPEYPELEPIAYEYANYVANRILIQTGLDAVEATSVLSGNPTYEPENSKEKAQINGAKGFYMWQGFQTVRHVISSLNPNDFPINFEHSAAYGYFADSLRATSIFQRYELLYRVVEYFFAINSHFSAKAVADHAQPISQEFTEEEIKSLKKIRHRIIHPKAREGRLIPGIMDAFTEVNRDIAKMRKLAKLLLDNPPTVNNGE